jgi:hypothetical protein
MVDYHPIAATVDSGPIEFNSPGTGDEYLDPASTYLYVSCRIKKSDGTDVAAEDEVGPENLLLHSLFGQVDVTLNDKLISSSSGNYAYRAVIETILNYGKAAKETQLTAALWYKDTAGSMESIDNNAGYTKRKTLTHGKTIDLVGRLHSDIFFQEKLLLNGVGMRVKLVRNRDNFVLHSSGVATNYRINIVKAVLRVRKVRVAPVVSLGHAAALETGNAKYPINRVECKTFSIQTGMQSVTQEQVFQGQLPSRIVIGCVDHDAFDGMYTKNPYNFKHYKMTKLSLEVDTLDGTKTIVSDFDNGLIAEGYMSLFIGARKAFKDEDLDVTRDDFVGGFALYCFDLTPDLGESDHYSLVKNGSVRLHLSFAEALRQTINVIVYGEFQNVLEVDRNRNVFYDFSA